MIPSLANQPYLSGGMAFLVGVSMLFSKRLGEASIVGKISFWIALNVMKPRTKYNHLIWGAFFLLFGIVGSFVIGLPDRKESEFFQQFHESYEYWIGITVVVLFNLLVGIYTAIKHRED